MKCISTRQPWAYLITKGIKPVENRTWSSDYRGPLLIHASLTFDWRGYRWIRRTFPLLELPAPTGYVLGKLIGRVEMIGCVTCHHSPWFCGPFGHVYTNPVEFPKPVALRGQLGIFDVPDEVLKYVGVDG